jgi:hypothetical protein
MDHFFDQAARILVPDSSAGGAGAAGALLTGGILATLAVEAQAACSPPCTGGKQCCGNTCRPSDETCCGNSSCKSNQQCCGGVLNPTSTCRPTSETCCGSTSCKTPTETCCEGPNTPIPFCRTPKKVCCGSTTCQRPQVCCSTNLVCCTTCNQTGNCTGSPSGN